MARVTICLLLIVGVIFTTEAAPQGFGQTGAQAQASASASTGGRFRPEPSYALIPPSGGRVVPPGVGANIGGNIGGRGLGPAYGTVGGRGVGPAYGAIGGRGVGPAYGAFGGPGNGSGRGTSISIAKSVSINRGPGTGFSQASSNALARGK